MRHNMETQLYKFLYLFAGIVCEEHANPMDIFLDALHDDGSVTPYAENYQKSSVRMTIQNDLDSETESHHQNSSSVHHSKGKSITYASGFFRQVSESYGFYDEYCVRTVRFLT
jgi:hypothetical protein